MILSEFDIVFATQKSEKGRVIAEYLSEHPLDDGHPIEPLFPDETVQFTDADVKSPEWKLFFDGAYKQRGAGIGAVLISEQGTHLPAAAKLLFEEDTIVTNNMEEYEDCILGLHMALDYEILKLRVFGDSDLII